MVRGAGMSRGCATCRQRKIKCDENQPECGRCSKSGRKCPGSVVGAVFLAFNGHDSTKSKRIENEHRDIRRTRRPVNQRNLATAIQQIFSISALTNDVHAPDPSDLLETQLRASFIAFFIRSGRNKTRSQSWLEYYLLRAENISILGWRESVLAATLALYGTHEQNPSAIAASYKWYDHALCFQRQNLSLYTENPRPQVNEMNISMAVILAYSEVALPTHPKAFSQHIKAAAALLQIVGPEACMQGNLHQMFLTLRVYMIYESFGERTASVFASSEWIHLPFQTRRKQLLDLVVDLLLQIPGAVASPCMAITSLKGLWCQLVECNPGLISSRRYTLLEQAPEFQDLWDCVPDKFSHSSSETAIALALYSFGWVVSISLLNQCGDHAAEYAELISGHCEAILDAAAFVSTIQDGCSYIRLTPPLRNVVYYGSNQTQRERAVGFIQVWGKSISLLQLSTDPLRQSWQFHEPDCLM